MRSLWVTYWQPSRICGQAKIAALICLGTVGCSPLAPAPQTTSSKPAEVSVSERDAAGPTGPSASPEDTMVNGLYDNDLRAQQILADRVIADLQRGITASDFATGSPRFDGEWAVGSYQLAVLGLGQMLLRYPELKADYLPVMQQAVERLVSPELNAFGTEAWGENGLTEAVLSSQNDHAYLGYTNLALSMLRFHQPRNRFADLNDRLTDAFVLRMKTKGVTLETYPGEAYPADIAAVLSSIALHNQATKGDRSPFLEWALERFQQKFVDSDTGLIFQAVDSKEGYPTDLPRASGTALSVYYLSFADLSLAQALFRPIADQQQSRVMGMVGIREYGPDQGGSGDVDSGELVMGISPSATVFALAGARLTGDRTLHHSLYNSIQILGNSPIGEQNGVSLLNGPLGNAMMLAMLTVSAEHL